MRCGILRPRLAGTWHAFLWAELVRRRAAHIKKNAPPGGDTSWLTP
jgi:hypothetical protein